MERDGIIEIASIVLVDFNSHAHVERDTQQHSYISHILISTHTLTWSVTMTLKFYTILFLISTHTLTWSVTGKISDIKQGDLISTHTLTWSVTDLKCSLMLSGIFQLTRSRGA